MKEIRATQYFGSPQDLQMRMAVSPGDTYEWSKVLLARARVDGTLELLTAAREKFSGHGRREFSCKTLSELMGSSKPAAIAKVAAILDEENPGPVELELRCRDGQGKRLRLHRRFDSYEGTVFIVAEETTAHERRARPR